MIPAEITTHVADGQALFIDEYQGKVLLPAVLASYLRQIQILENVFFDILEKRWIWNATGAQLDTLGKLVGQPRIGPTDDVYRLWILARARANRSNGEADDIIEVALLVLQGLAFTYTDIYPASFVVTVTDPMTVDAPSVAAIIAITRGTGIGSALIYSSADDADTFCFSSTSSPDADANRGWASSEAAVGGQFANAL